MKIRLAVMSACVAAIVSVDAQANDMAAAARAFVEDRFAAVLTAPQVVSAIEAQNKEHEGLSPDRIIELDNAWRAGDASLIDGILSNALSKYLETVVADSEGAFSEIFVMDFKGLNVGQSAKTSDYWQGDEAKWKETFVNGTVHISDVEEDESTQTFQVQVSMPIMHNGTAIGAITFGIDVAALE